MEQLLINPIKAFLEHQRVMILDGGLATTLEDRGHVLDDTLWSARILIENPNAILDVHRDFLLAGADCITTATYQASLAGFQQHGLGRERGMELMDLSTRIAVQARDTFWRIPRNQEGRERPMVAASIGPYGAYLADGSEFTGNYGIGVDELYLFHRDRWDLLSGSAVDLLACETIPTLSEAHVLLRLLRETPRRWGWFSFTCSDEGHLRDGTPFAEAVKICDDEPRVAGIGVNCTSPKFVSGLIAQAKKETSKPILVYPNRGEGYDAATKRWIGEPAVGDWGKAAQQWSREGAAAIGGCCRVGPEDIRKMRLQGLKN